MSSSRAVRRRSRRWRPGSAAGTGRTTRLAAFQISHGRHRDHLGQALAAHARSAPAARPTAFGERLVGLLPARRRHDLAVDQPRAGRGRRARSAGRAPRRRTCPASSMTARIVSSSTLDHAAGDQLVEAGGRLEREHDVVYWSAIGHGARLALLECCSEIGGRLGRNPAGRKGAQGLSRSGHG